MFIENTVNFVYYNKSLLFIDFDRKLVQTKNKQILDLLKMCKFNFVRAIN